jgi:hypothetical protein
MILYHFTKPMNVEAIRRDGLLPTLSDNSLSMVGCAAVFLCDTPTTAVTGFTSAKFRRRRSSIASSKPRRCWSLPRVRRDRLHKRGRPPEAIPAGVRFSMGCIISALEQR